MTAVLVAASVLMSSLGIGAEAQGAQQPIATGPSAFAESTVDAELLGRPHSPNVVAGRSAVVAAVGHRLSGPATWYRWRVGQAAAGPRLRAALGSHWRGRIVSVRSAGRLVRVKLSDWCFCGSGRVIDLDHRSFRSLAPLSMGIVRVVVSW